MMLCDYHIHSKFSNDSEADLLSICRSAVEKGISEIAITDHAEFGPLYPGYPDVEEYISSIRSTADEFKDLSVLVGLEMGDANLFGDEPDELLKKLDPDFVVGSCHYANGLEPAWEKEFFEKHMDDAYEVYLKQVLENVLISDFDVLGHLDIIKRDAFKFGIQLNKGKCFDEMVRSILKALIDRGKGLEINTSPLRKGLNETCPSFEILKVYKDMGGEILTFGSDAHVPADLGSNFSIAIEIAHRAGFKNFTRFKKRKASFESITAI